MGVCERVRVGVCERVRVRMCEEGGKTEGVSKQRDEE